MSGFIEGENRQQSTLLPERIDDYVDEDSVVRVVDVFLLGFKTEYADTGRPSYHPRTMLKRYVYGYLHQVHSSRRLEHEANRKVELMWLTGKLAPDFKTIAGLRQSNNQEISVEHVGVFARGRTWNGKTILQAGITKYADPFDTSCW